MNVRQALIDAGERLDGATREAVLALGSDAVPELIDVLEDEDLLVAGGPGDGFAPVHAVGLLGELGDPRAVEPLVAVIVRGDWTELVVDAACLALPKHGQAALEPLLRAHDAEPDPFDRALFGCQLADLGVRDERIYERLVAHLEEHPDVGAGSLAVYGEARALPLLHRALDASEPGTDAEEIVELTHAIEELGGELTEEQEAKRAAAVETRRGDAAFVSASGRLLAPRETLRALHEALADGDGPSAWQVRGHLAALASQPSLAMPSAWLPNLLADRGDPEAINALLEVYNATLEAIGEDASDVCPSRLDEEAATAFCSGYAEAALDDPEWVNARLATEPLGLVLLLAGIGAGDVDLPPEQRDEALAIAREHLPEILEEIHEELGPLRLELAKRGARRTAPKVGRNDPCPCGSGKKHKRCCAN